VVRACRGAKLLDDPRQDRIRRGGPRETLEHAVEALRLGSLPLREGEHLAVIGHGQNRQRGEADRDGQPEWVGPGHAGDVDDKQERDETEQARDQPPRGRGRTPRGIVGAAWIVPVAWIAARFHHRREHAPAFWWCPDARAVPSG
jgi:hypothetical protein